MYAEGLEKRPVAHDGSLFMIQAQSWAFVRELLTVYKKRKVANIAMLKFYVLLSREQIKSVFLTMVNRRWDPRRRFDRQGLLSGGEYERLEFDSPQVLQPETPLAQCRIVIQQYGAFGFRRLTINWASKN